ncbi:hypothetical protein FRC08_009709 [Ceratobasidium sp. 394]|nr:hypothetical protein FRC08_009709 [Ceratobasidium sp. 394]
MLKLNPNLQARMDNEVCQTFGVTILVTQTLVSGGDKPVRVKKDDADRSSDSESSGDDGGIADAKLDREIEKLMYEASDTESDPESRGEAPAEGEKANNRVTRHGLYDSTAMNISMLVLTCWWLRVPATYLDFISLINSYRIPYLDAVRLLPANMKKHLSVALRQELNPTHAPTVTALHVITRRIARSDIQTHDGHTTSAANAPNVAIPPEALKRPSSAQDAEDRSIKLPGQSIINWSPNDPLGILPPDYGLLIETASVWSGVEQSTINRLVGLFERRLQRYSPKRRQLEVSDSDMDNEYIDLDQQSQRSSPQDDISENTKYEDEDEGAEIKTSANGYKLGSRNWRERVHNKLSASNRSKGAYKENSPGSEGDEPESEDSDWKPSSEV